MKTLNTVTTQTRANKAIARATKLKVVEYKNTKRGLNTVDLKLVEDSFDKKERMEKNRMNTVKGFICRSEVYPYIKEEFEQYCDWVLNTLLRESDLEANLSFYLENWGAGTKKGVCRYLGIWDSSLEIMGTEVLSLTRKAEAHSLLIDHLCNFLLQEIHNLSETEWEFYSQMSQYYSKVTGSEDVVGRVWRAWELSNWSLDEYKMLSAYEPEIQYGYDMTRGRTHENPWSFLDVKFSEIASSVPRKYRTYSNDENINSGFYELYKDSLPELGKSASLELMKAGRFREVQKASDVLGIALNAYGYDLNEGMDVSSVKRTASVSRLLVLLREGFKPSIKMKVLNDLGYTAEQKASLLILSRVLGKEVVNLGQFFLFEEHIPKNIADIIPVPAKFQKWVSTQSLALTWVLEEGLDIDWNLKLSAKQNIVKAISFNYNVDEDTAELIYTTPGIIESVEFAGKNPQTCGEGVLPDVELSYEGYTMSRLEKKDVTNLYIGELTSCCQKLGGFGEAVCTEGWNDLYSSNYVFKKGGEILAHVWVWKAQDGSLVLDSIEGKGHADCKAVYELLLEFRNLVDSEVILGSSSYGLTIDIIKLFLQEFPEARNENLKIPKSIQKYTYQDAEEGSLGYSL